MKKRIREGEFTPGSAIPSERQLALDYGVSRITIVKALDLLVDDDLIERQHGRGNFVRDQSESTLYAENCRIAFCVPEPSESYIFSTLFGATKVAMRHRIHLQPVKIGDGEEEVKQVRELVEHNYDGVILFSRSTDQNAAFYQELQDKRYPFVMLDRYCPEVSTDRIVFDDANATYRLTEILINAGHRRIALLLSTETFATAVQERLVGYRQALEDHNITYNPRWVGQSIYEVFDIEPENLDELRTTYITCLETIRHTAPTAVISINNYSAEQVNIDLAKIQLELMHAVIDAGVKDIDYEIKVDLASISHKPLSLNLTPLIALAIQSGETIGEKVMELLLGRISKTIPDTPQKLVVPMEIQTFT
jgi:LacI family transcriptional regulator